MSGFKKYQKNNRDTNNQKRKWKPEYKKYRVKSAIKSFRDLEVYKQTTQLSAEIFQFQLPATIKGHKRFVEEIEILYQLSKQVPRLIAESYGARFNNFNLAMQKLEKSMQTISIIITKIDFLLASINKAGTSGGILETLSVLIKKYQKQRTKVLNLKRAWDRVFNKK